MHWVASLDARRKALGNARLLVERPPTKAELSIHFLVKPHMMNEHSRLALTMLALLVSTSCSAENECNLVPPEKTVELMAGLRSFQTIDQAISRMSSRAFVQIEGDITDVQCERQPVNRLAYSGVSVFGYAGRLELVFYFGRLAETRFHPSSPASFFSFAASKGLPYRPGEERAMSADRIYWVAGRAAESETLGVEDDRLTDRLESWIRSHD